MFWFLLPPGKNEGDGRPLPQGWVKRLLWTDSAELEHHVSGLGRDRRAAALLGVMESAEDALVNALAGHRADRLRGVARQLRDVAGTLERAEKKRRR